MQDITQMNRVSLNSTPAASQALPTEITHAQKAQKAQNTSNSSSDEFFGEDGLSFGDILDAINPLQHIPVVSTIYRAITGDQIDPGARLAGGAMFGGPIGFVASLINSAIESVSGEDIGGHVMALFEETGTAPAPEAQIASHTYNVAQQPYAKEERTLSAAPLTSVSVASLDAPEQTPLPLNVANVNKSSDAEPSAVKPEPLVGSFYTSIAFANDVENHKEKADHARHSTTGHTTSKPQAETSMAIAMAAQINPNRMADFMEQAMDKYEALMKERYAQTGAQIEASYRNDF